MYDVAYDVLNHRLVLSFDAVADDVTVDDVLVKLLTEIVAPRLSSSELASRAAARRTFVARSRHEHHRPSPRRPTRRGGASSADDQAHLALLGAHRVGCSSPCVRRLDGLLAGDHAGLFPGHGTERGEARPYVPGDDPRHIDWAVTARTNDPHVRDTIADHELELWLVLDTSSSHAFGTGRSTKHELAWTAAGAFALLASRGGNRIGAVASGEGGRLIPARSGRAHTAAVLTALRTPPADGDAGDLARAIRLVRKAAKRRGMAIVVSDFLGEPTWERSLRALTLTARGDRRAGERPPRVRTSRRGLDRGRRPRDRSPTGRRHRRPRRAGAVRGARCPPADRAHRTPRLDRRRPPRAAHRPRLGARRRPLRRPAPHPASHRLRCRPPPRQDLTMTALAFLAPARLVLLALPIILAVAYLVVQARRRRYALRFTTLDLLDEVAPDRPGWRRHLPAAVLLAGTVAATLAVARPAVAREFSEPQRIVVLAIDTSLSMQATDVAPRDSTRRRPPSADFLDTVPDGVAVGVVAFDSEARQLIQPTTNLDAVRRDDRARRPRRGHGHRRSGVPGARLDRDGVHPARQRRDPTQPTSPPAGTIVLLSDGETTDGRPNDEAAAEAKAQGIAVNTIAFGTDSGTIEDPLTGEQVPVPVNEAALGELARATGGQSLRPRPPTSWPTCTRTLGRSLQVDVERREVTDWFAGAALLMLVLAATGSLFWFGRLP